MAVAAAAAAAVRGDVTYDASCTRATWSADRSDFEDSEQFLLVLT